MSRLYAVEWSPTINTVPYSIGDVLGIANPYTLSVNLAPHNGIILQSLIVRDKANQKFGIDFLFFSALPTGTYTNNAAFAIDAADKAKIIGQRRVLSTDYVTLNSSFAIATQDDIGMTFGPTTAEGTLALYCPDNGRKQPCFVHDSTHPGHTHLRCGLRHFSTV